MTMALIVPINAAVARVLTSSTRVCAENSRVNPFKGLRRSNFGARALPDSRNPPSNAEEKIATAANRANKGSSVSATCSADSQETDNMAPVSRATRGSIHRPACTAMCRSEEHTSELQSLMRISYAVFCLKKKKKQKEHRQRYTNTYTAKSK